MLSHDQIWRALDMLATRYGLSPSGLARRSGLDPTTFNRSKRAAADGRLRWPSTESIAKVLEATGASLDEFVALVAGRDPGGSPAAATGETRGAKRRATLRPRPASVPVVDLAHSATADAFHGGPAPADGEVSFPGLSAGRLLGLKVSGPALLPLYRDGDIIVVSPGARVRKGDRVVVRTRAGEVTARELAGRTAHAVELRPIDPARPVHVVPLGDIAWMARIIWARH
ncbi:S24 family peptidase [Chelatococcus reniformis]|uniref:Transcriptional regulator n=1 Tax=Chelatococcus reniformis TaxID=1494448 RepID=A0A916UXP4_9HYPH|nr:helix-turn-helix transcriptional regulator [Chelatococcus reniformis]GGC93460.1 transcriptional regulator [Chelatococcus reniformis]